MMAVKEDTRYSCQVCDKPSKLVAEWYGVNQYGRSPELVAEQGSCLDFRHLIESSYIQYNFFNFPDKVVDAETELKYSSLTELLIKALLMKEKKEDLTQICEQGQFLLNRMVDNPNQLKLFPD